MKYVVTEIKSGKLLSCVNGLTSHRYEARLFDTFDLALEIAIEMRKQNHGNLYAVIEFNDDLSSDGEILL